MAILTKIRSFKSELHDSINLTNVRDLRLSWKAKGIFTYVITTGPTWELRTADLLKKSLDSKSSLFSGINELIKAGYLYRGVEKNEKGRVTNWIYYIFEKPTTLEQFKEALNGEPFELR